MAKEKLVDDVVKNFDVNTHDFTLAYLYALTEMMTDMNKKINALRFMNKVYLGVSLFAAYKVYKTLKKEKEEDIVEETE